MDCTTSSYWWPFQSTIPWIYNDTGPYVLSVLISQTPYNSISHLEGGHVETKRKHIFSLDPLSTYMQLDLHM